jgi:hypothetical protein
LETGCGVPLGDAQLRGPRRGGGASTFEPRHDRALELTGMDEVHRVDPSRLTEPVDAPDALLESAWAPRQFEVDDTSTAVLKV